MNPQGFLPTKPLPIFFVNMGQGVANFVRFTTGMDIPYQEGLMLIVSTIVMAVSIVLWIIIDVGNRADKTAHMAVLEARSVPANRQAQARRSMEVERMHELARNAGAMNAGSEAGELAGVGVSGAYLEKLYRRDASLMHGSGLRKKMT
ncbi:hypothetical protein Vretimale_1291 [Volvox reticuliferus]|uniref:Uncharacterized protein n=1 Tax=Volvox reticuliferus TaxID=1737510 RepID=A0A8J4CKP4_9CHLO|nr:hypothetical protein Vretifemale_10653 [Volvox reticuliferus]GIL95209.1 hypothetical protein Vretimale_1291 [Volvox reticuliferus]